MWSSRALIAEIVYRSDDVPTSRQNDAIVPTSQQNVTSPLPLQPLLISEYFQFVHVPPFSEYVKCIDEVEPKYQGYTENTSCSTKKEKKNYSTGHSDIEVCEDEVKLTFNIQEEFPPDFTKYCTLMRSRQSNDVFCFISSEGYQENVDLHQIAEPYITQTIIKTAKGQRAERNYNREIRCYNELFNCSSPHLVRVIAANSETYTLKMEKMTCSLFQQLQKRDTIKVRNLHSDVLCGLKALQERGFSHRDIKPGNILYDENTGVYKLTDFGTSALTTEENISQRGTPPYVLPNHVILNPGHNRGQANDKFGIGIILLQIVKDLRAEKANYEDMDNPKYWEGLKQFFNQILTKRLDTDKKLSDEDYVWLYFKEEVIPMINLHSPVPPSGRQ